MLTLSINVGEDVGIRYYFSKPKGVREGKKFGKHCCTCIPAGDIVNN
jgi:hypothetical protein